MQQMKHEKLVKIILITLPAIALAMCFIPGMVSYVGLDKLIGKKYMMVQPLPEGTIANVSLVVILFTVFTLAMGIVYANSPGRASSRMYMIMNIVNLLFSLAPIWVDEHLVIFPYLLFPVLFAIILVISIPVCIKETDLYYDRATEFYE